MLCMVWEIFRYANKQRIRTVDVVISVISAYITFVVICYKTNMPFLLKRISLDEGACSVRLPFDEIYDYQFIKSTIVNQTVCTLLASLTFQGIFCPIIVLWSLNDSYCDLQSYAVKKSRFGGKILILLVFVLDGEKFRCGEQKRLAQGMFDSVCKLECTCIGLCFEYCHIVLCRIGDWSRGGITKGNAICWKPKKAKSWKKRHCPSVEFWRWPFRKALISEDSWNTNVSVH